MGDDHALGRRQENSMAMISYEARCHLIDGQKCRLPDLTGAVLSGNGALSRLLPFLSITRRESPQVWAEPGKDGHGCERRLKAEGKTMERSRPGST